MNLCPLEYQPQFKALAFVIALQGYLTKRAYWLSREISYWENWERPKPTKPMFGMSLMALLAGISNTDY